MLAVTLLRIVPASIIFVFNFFYNKTDETGMILTQIMMNVTHQTTMLTYVVQMQHARTWKVLTLAPVIKVLLEKRLNVKVKTKQIFCFIDHDFNTINQLGDKVYISPIK